MIGTQVSRIIKFVAWLFNPPVPAIDIGGALIAGGWALAFWLDPAIVTLPSYRSLAMIPQVVLVAMMAIVALAHAMSILWPAVRTQACLAAGFIWITAAAGFGANHAWPGLVTYAVLGIGTLLAAIYSEASRN